MRDIRDDDEKFDGYDRSAEDIWSLEARALQALEQLAETPADAPQDMGSDDAEWAVQSATDDVGRPPTDLTPNTLVAYENRLQGRAGELAAFRELERDGRSVTDLNEICKNAAGYDLVTDHGEFVQVKAYDLGSEMGNVAGYRHTLDLLSNHAGTRQCGRYEGLQPTEVYAARLLQQDDSRVGEIIDGDDMPELADRMRREGYLSVPADHAEHLVDYLQNDFADYVERHPERYGLDPVPSNVERASAIQDLVDDYVRRVRPMTCTSQELMSELNRKVPIRGRL